MNRRDVEPLELRIDRDPLAALQASIEANRAAVDEDEIDLGVRHAERFDRVLDRGRSRDLTRDRALPLIGRQVVVELFVEPEFTRRGFIRVHAGSARTWLQRW